MKVAEYFKSMQLRPDRVGIKLEWIEKAIANPLKVETQADRRKRCWVKIEENEGRYLRVILLEDGETVHNAFFDRNFKEIET
ncbi:hypothetical protein HCU40_11160 [Pseudanabaena biceps]|nr:hypothetical protein [Pseudanabaena biceps]